MTMRRVKIAVLAVSAVVAAPCAARADVLESALLQEIARSTQSLTQEGQPPPYFISLRVTDEETNALRCVLGSPSVFTFYRGRRLTPDVRVGSYELDNHPLQPSGGSEGVDIPYGEDLFAIRHALWTTLDAAYKSSVAGFLRKQALRIRRGKADYETDDLSRETPARAFAPAAAPEQRRKTDWMEPYCAAISGAFRTRTRTLSAGAEARWVRVRERLRTSEGVATDQNKGLAHISLHVQDIASDGMYVYASRSWMAPAPEGLPSLDRIREESRDMAADLNDLVSAVSTAPMTAPALIDPTVSSALFQAIAARLSGEEQRNPSGAQTFAGKVGKKILPGFLTLIDDPTALEFHGKALVGGYGFDDQGVPARRSTLVEKGLLRSFLLSRYPVVGFAHSNGHGRSAPGFSPMGRPSNLFVEASAPLASRDMLGALRKECRRRGKSHGLWIQRARSWNQQGGTGRQQAFRLSPTRIYLVDVRTGSRTLVRNLDMVGTPIELAARILAAADDPQAVDALVDQESGKIPVTTIAPSLLLSEVELQRAETKPQRPPILEPPAADNAVAPARSAPVK